MTNNIKGNAIIKAENVTKNFGGVRAVRDVNLEIARGELHSLIGPNGAGKSTFFKLITGFEIPSSGKIFYKDQDITELKPYQRLRLGIALKFQTPRIYPSLTVGQNLEIPWSKNLGATPDETKFEILMEMSGLNQCQHMEVAELPHGQLQWLEVCMILKTGPSILLLDEPTAGMSPEETFKTAEMIEEINNEDFTIIIIEHDMAFVKELARKVTVFHRGEVFAQGSMEEISADPRVKKIYLGE